MQIDVRRGQAGNLKAVENSQSAAECDLDGCKVRLPRDLADKIANGDDVLVVGRLHNELFHADALRNFTQGRTAQLDSSNYIIGLGFGMFITFLCAIQSYHLFAEGSNTTGTAMVLASVGGIVGMLLTGQRFLAISKATKQVRVTTT